MASIINATVTSPGGLVSTGDNTNELKIQTGETDALTVSSSQVVTFNNPIVVGTNAINAENSLGFRNRIINGDMRIDQRNAGAEVNPAVNGTYYLDRFQVGSTSASKFKIGQNAGSVTPPAGFINYLGCTSLSAYTVGASDVFVVQQRIEGLNIADLAWGTASAETVTLSFWVYSSLTGTFGGSLRNSGFTRSYPFSYTISSANTWEQKTITIVGDTSGTWLTTNGIGISLCFGLGVGSTLSSTAGAWGAGNFISATGATSVVGTNGATFYITGVQLEVGSVATPFERRDYGRELIMCQRYYQRLGSGAWGYIYATTNADVGVQFPVTMRATPTVSHIANYSLTSIALANYTVTNTVINPSSTGTSLNGMFLRLTSSGMSAGTNACISTESNVGFSSEL